MFFTSHQLEVIHPVKRNGKTTMVMAEAEYVEAVQRMFIKAVHVLGTDECPSFNVNEVHELSVALLNTMTDGVRRDVMIDKDQLGSTGSVNVIADVAK